MPRMTGDLHDPQRQGRQHLQQGVVGGTVLIRRAAAELGGDRIWVNPDCGLKTRRAEEVGPALAHMVAAARTVRAEITVR